jgi:GTP-binding protein
MSDIDTGDIEEVEVETTERKPLVAIVGRPNVGKSALFNRIVGRRVAIVHSQSGVTRDRLIREVNVDEKLFDLVDTGGIGNLDNTQSDDIIEAGIRKQVDAALVDAKLAILVTDIETGVVPLDQEVARLLRASGVTVIIAANKADTGVRDDAANVFTSLGYDAYPVSALHGRGDKALLEIVAKHLPKVINQTEKNPLRVAVVGRPNVGKSSYINRLLNSDRIITADMPGTTRDSVDVPFAVGSGPNARHYTLIDTAGLRRRGKVDSPLEKFSSFRAEDSIRRSNVCVIVIDASAGPTTQDKKIAALVATHEKGAVILVNKWDIAESTQRQYLPALIKEMPFLSHCPMVMVSAKDGFNVRKTIETIDGVAAQVRTQLPTGVLNRAMLDAHERISPPTFKGKRLKIYYCTQVGVEPIRIRLFVNHPRHVPLNYRQYLIRSMRERFGLEGAPVVLDFRERTGRKTY